MARKPRQHPERALQKAVAGYLTYALPEGSGVEWTAFPAGGGGHVRGAILKAMGLKAGWPDILVVHQGLLHGIELKAPKTGRVSAKQGDTIQRLHTAGVTTHVCRSVEGVEEALRLSGVPLRGSVSKGRGV